MSAATILRDAADLLEPRGAWTQGDYEARRPNGQHCYCAVGAIERVSMDMPGSSRAAVAALRRYLASRTTTFVPRTTVHPDGAVVIGWNDRPSRRKGQVIAAMRAAADAEEARDAAA